MHAKKKAHVHSRCGTELVRALAGEGDRIFTNQRARELASSVGMSDGYLRQALHYLVRAGWLVRLRKGLYAISSSVPGAAPAHEYEIAMHLVEPAAIAFRSAMHHHGMTEQIPRDVHVLTTTAASIPRTRSWGRHPKKRGGHLIAGATYRFVQVKPERYFGASKVWINDARVSVTDPERTLLDGLMKPGHCGDFAEVLHAFEMRTASLDIERITGYALRLDAAIAMRLGWVLEQFGVDSSRLARLRRRRVRGYRPLDPSGPRRGPCDNRWMIQENLPGRIREGQKRRT
jgi:predicted transcriptional regulator of viral defense system